MEIDEEGVNAAQPVASTSKAAAAAVAADGTATLQRLEQLASKPYNYALHVENVKAAQTDDEREEARNFMASMLPLTEELWLEWIKDKRSKFEQADSEASFEAAVEVLELYKRACNDYLSIRIRKDYASFAVSLWYTMRGYDYPAALEEGNESQEPDPSRFNDVGAGVFTEDFIRDELEMAVSPVARHHLSESHQVWQILHDFELDQTRRSASPDAVARMHGIYMQRLAEPHVHFNLAHEAFSRFISKYAESTYETSMVEAREVYSKPKAAAEVRIPEEDKLEKAKFSAPAYKRYLAWEQEVKKPDTALVRVLYERALKRCYYDVELWQDFLAFLLSASRRKNTSVSPVYAIDQIDILDACQRAVRSCPASGQLAASAIRTLEALGDFETSLDFATNQCTRVTDSTLFEGALDEFVQVFLAKADLLRHEGDEHHQELVDTLKQGISQVKTLSKDSGDPRLQLERYLLRIHEKSGDHAAISDMYGSLAKMYPNSATLIMARAEHAIKSDDLEVARKLYVSGTKKRLDYPEYLFESWLAFEHRDGTLSTLDKAMSAIKHEMKFITARRQKEAQKAYASAAATLQGGENEAGAAAMQAVAKSSLPAESTETTNTSTKRRASEELAINGTNVQESAPAVKKAKQDHPTPELKRDRENATVSISNLPANTEETALKRLFRDCGEVRECKIKTLNGNTIATVEFMTKDAVPAALTKDKKQVDGSEITVHPDWQSTLYVTNFPEDFDASDLQQLFEPYGPIFEVRWPSKRLKASRRFAYVQYASQASAKEALVLHQREVPLGSGLHMQVKLSDPARKLNRSDANANKKEIYVNGLPRFAKEADLRKLFESFGTIKGVRISLDDQGACKGFGFIDFDTEEAASAALTMNNSDYKKRRLGVTMADGRVTQKPKPTGSGQSRAADLASRSVSVANLPEDCQEGLLQQFFEKDAEVEAVQVHSGTGRATITFKDAADAGKLALQQGLVYEGRTLSIDADPASRAAGPPSAGMILNPRGRGSGRAGRARGSRLGIGAARSSKSTTSSAAVSQSGEPAMIGKAPADAGSSSGKSQADFRAFLQK